ncbi:dihydrodipicolinate synthase family protein [Polaromonas sp. P1(28)-8]|nr:dihydrodipicolinate synthase family protein [Polaromonas sp. P1(28)-8]
MKKLSGVMPAVTTPFRSNGVIDHDMMIARCRHLFSTGCDGINLLGTTGEGSSVSISERISLMEEISTAGMEISNFMVSTGTPALGDTLKLTHKAVELGFRNLLVLPPYYFKNLDDDGMADYFSELVKVAEACGCQDLSLPYSRVHRIRVHSRFCQSPSG